MPRFSREHLPYVTSSFGLGVLATLALVEHRLSHGSQSIAVLSLALLLGVTAGTAQVTRVLTRDRSLPVSFAEQACAMGVAIIGIHGVLAAMIALGHDDGALAGLRESPAQLVNDLALGGSLLLFAWSFVVRGGLARAGVAALALFLVGAYGATASAWHVDAIDFPHLTTQAFVCTQVVGISTGLLGLHWVTPSEG